MTLHMFSLNKGKKIDIRYFQITWQHKFYSAAQADPCGYNNKKLSISHWGRCGRRHVKLIASYVQLCSVLSNNAGQPFVCLDHHRCCTLHGMPGQGLIFCRLINHHKEGSKLHTTLVVNLITHRYDCQMVSVWDQDDKYRPAAERQGLVLGRKGLSAPFTLLGEKGEMGAG